MAALWDDYGQGGEPEAWTFAYDALDPQRTGAGRLTGVSGSYGAQYEYTPIGNPSASLRAGMTVRVVDGVTYSQTWSSDNRLVEVVSGGEVVSFTYNADGALVKKVVDGETTHYVGNYYERGVEGAIETTYYYFGDQRVALRKAGARPLTG